MQFDLDSSDGIQAISASSLPLPSGAATEAKQTQPGVDIGDVTINNTSGAGAVNIQDGGNSITVDGSVSLTGVNTVRCQDGFGNGLLTTTSAPTGTETGLIVRNLPTGTQAISAASLPLPTGAATETTLSALNTKVPSGLTVTSTRLLTDGSGVTQPISAASLPLPSGASTSALQTTGNTSLSSIDTKTPALGQALAAASVPVVLTAAQLSTLTPLSSVSVSNFPATQPISAASLPLPTGAATETTLSAVSGKLPATLGQKAMANSLAVVIASDQSSIPVTGTFTAESGLGGLETYVCNTGPITGATATGTKSLAYLWHPSSVTKKYKIASIIVDQIAGNGPSGSQRIEMNRITAENGTPGGSTGTIVSKEPGATASGATVRIAATGAPTRASGTLFGVGFDPKSSGQVLPMGSTEQERIEIKPWTVLASTAFGYELTQVVTSTLSSAPIFNITVEWTES